MAVTGTQVVHEDNFIANTEVDVVVGRDRVVRLNVDGVCVARVRMTKDCTCQISGMVEGLVPAAYPKKITDA